MNESYERIGDMSLWSEEEDPMNIEDDDDLEDGEIRQRVRKEVRRQGS